MKITLFLKGIKITGLIVAIYLLAACSNSLPDVREQQSDTQRWYSQSQVLRGKQIYESNCQGCHNKNAKGTREWKKSLADGSYPPPPLNGSAHAWHHSLEVLLKTVNEGGVPMGGKMPPFRTVLNQDEKLAVIAYFQSFWKDKTYQTWLTRNP